MRLRGLTLAVAVVSLAGASAGVAGSVRGHEGDDLAPTGKGWGEHRGPAHPQGQAAAARVRGSGIKYHGGPLLVAGPNVYYIWYGNWSSTAQSILTDLANGLGGSPYFNINSTYFNASNVHVANVVTLAGTAFDNYSQGTSLSDAAIQAVVAAQNPDRHERGLLRADEPGRQRDERVLHAVLRLAHARDDRRPRHQVRLRRQPGPLSERLHQRLARRRTATSARTGRPRSSPTSWRRRRRDPDLNAWYDSRGAENADKCAWTFGTTSNNGTGVYNMVLGGRDFLIQRNWVNAGSGSCATQYP